MLFDRFFLSVIFVVSLEILFQQFFELDAMHIIILLLGLEVALFSSFTYSLPIAGSIQHAGFDKYPMNAKKRFWFGNSGDFLMVLMPIPGFKYTAEC